MSKREWSKGVEVSAREMAGNWRAFGSFAWFGRERYEDADQRAIVYLSNRDSDCAEESNAAYILAALAKADPEGVDYQEESHSHCMVGHVDGVVILPMRNGVVTPAFAALHDCMTRLEDHPVLDEDDLSKREDEAAQTVWRDSYSDAERIAYMRDHDSQFEFGSFADMLGCARGRYFAGYASELLY